MENEKIVVVEKKNWIWKVVAIAAAVAALTVAAIAIWKVRLYDKVTVYIPDDEEEMVVSVVSTVRVSLDRGFISLESPLGKAILGKEVGSVVSVKVNDSYSYDVEIRHIERGEDDGSAPLMRY